MFSSIKEINASELANWIENGADALKILDVREYAEMAQGMISGAEPIPLATVPQRMKEFSANDTLVVVCRSGARSAQACQFLQQQGFKNVYNLQRGMLGWASANLPMVAYVGAQA